MSDGERRRKKVERLRARDGDDCWLCGRPMLFGGAARGQMTAATLDHVIERRNGGTSRMDNLRLAHARCNMHRDKKFPHTAGPNNAVPPKKQRAHSEAYERWLAATSPGARKRAYEATQPES